MFYLELGWRCVCCLKIPLRPFRCEPSFPASIKISPPLLEATTSASSVTNRKYSRFQWATCFSWKVKAFQRERFSARSDGFCSEKVRWRFFWILNLFSWWCFDGVYHGKSPILINGPFGEYVWVLFCQPPFARKSKKMERDRWDTETQNIATIEFPAP